MINIKFKKLVPEAKLPTKAHLEDAAYDLYCCETVTLFPGQTKKIRTGLQLADMSLVDGEDNLFLQIEGRSGIASEGVFPVGGIIDPIYRGEILVILHNGRSFDFSYSTETQAFSVLSPAGKTFNAGDKIAQFVIRRTPRNVLIEEAEEVTITTRGANGFGSTGT